MYKWGYGLWEEGEDTAGRRGLANNLLKLANDADVTVFLMGDAVFSAKAGQKTPNGYYNLEKMLMSVLNGGATVLLCGTCMDARGLTEDEVVAGCKRSTLNELTECTIAADKVLVF